MTGLRKTRSPENTRAIYVPRKGTIAVNTRQNRMIWSQPSMLRSAPRAAARRGGRRRSARRRSSRAGRRRSYAVHQLDEAVERDEGHEGQCDGNKIHGEDAAPAPVKRSYRCAFTPYRFRKAQGGPPIARAFGRLLRSPDVQHHHSCAASHRAHRRGRPHPVAADRVLPRHPRDPAPAVPLPVGRRRRPHEPGRLDRRDVHRAPARSPAPVPGRLRALRRPRGRVLVADRRPVPAVLRLAGPGPRVGAAAPPPGPRVGAGGGGGGGPLPPFSGSQGRGVVDVVVQPATSQSRWGIFFRTILVLPASLLIEVFRFVNAAIAFLGWFYCLFTGRMEPGMQKLNALLLRYEVQAAGYVFLLTSRYPRLD